MSREIRNWPLRIYDMQQEIENLQGFRQNLSKGELYSDVKIQYAVSRSLEIMGEAAKKVPEDIKRQHPSVPWAELCKFRDVIAHDYYKLKLDVLWVILTDKIPAFENDLLAIEIPEEL